MGADVAWDGCAWCRQAAGACCMPPWRTPSAPDAYCCRGSPFRQTTWGERERKEGKSDADAEQRTRCGNSHERKKEVSEWLYRWPASGTWVAVIKPVLCKDRVSPRRERATKKKKKVKYERHTTCTKRKKGRRYCRHKIQSAVKMFVTQTPK